MDYKDEFSTWVEVDLGAVEGNVRAMKAHSGLELMAVVKANGYGHGADQVARAAKRGGASWFGVARLEEALELRLEGIDCPLLILGYSPTSQAVLAITQDISMTVWNSNQVQRIAEAARQVGKAARLHLKVDTGMKRLGVQPEEALPLALEITQTAGVTFEGMFTHYARSDETDQTFTKFQESEFHSVVSQLEAEGLRPKWVHAANSAAGLTRPTDGCNLVRTGIAIYGLHPSGECPLTANYKPALSWKTVLTLVKMVPCGSGISYNHEYVTGKEERIGTIPVGYADGLRRKRVNEVLVRGRRVPVIGRVCMDQAMVNLDSVPEAKDGDEVVLIGEQGAECMSAEQVAARWGTNNYEVVCGIGARVPRMYIR